LWSYLIGLEKNLATYIWRSEGDWNSLFSNRLHSRTCDDECKFDESFEWNLTVYMLIIVWK